MIIHFLRSSLPGALIPPAGLIWVIIAGLVIRGFRKRTGTIIFGVGLGGLYLLSLPAVAGALVASLETRQSPPAAAPPPGAIIVLGADADRTNDLPDRAAPGPLSLQRLATAALLARKTDLPVLISGGSVGKNEPAVGALMASHFESAFGLKATWREINSLNTCENAKFSAAMLRKAGIPAAYVVTHAWHMPRAILSFERAGYPVIAAPVYGDAHELHGISDFLPQTNAWVRSFFAIHEWAGLIAYRLGACPRSGMPDAAVTTGL
jgi:uncharacterized SAM-binding protein YcdF (DUF218 family)